MRPDTSVVIARKSLQGLLSIGSNTTPRFIQRHVFLTCSLRDFLIKLPAIPPPTASKTIRPTPMGTLRFEAAAYARVLRHGHLLPRQA